MINNFSVNIQRGLEVIKDLRCLLHHRDQLFLDELSYSLEELKRIELQGQGFSNLSFLEAHLNESLENLLRDCLIDHSSLNELKISCPQKGIESYQWNRLLFLVPKVISFLKGQNNLRSCSLNYGVETFDIILNKNELDLSSSQNFLLDLTKNCLKEFILPTLEIKDQFKLSFDISYHAKSFLRYSYPHKKIQLFLPGILEKYLLLRPMVHTENLEHIIEIDEGLNIRSLKKLTLDQRHREDSLSDHFYFSFPFRPLHLIISGSGERTQLSHDGIRGESKSFDDLLMKLGQSHYFLDFFALFSR